ncbi:LPS translocon maturation chaperone LptM [Zhongshania sp. BJYM1]|uniref:LPS translocon maturation chaperone LptM n=1 Tax=Zhongshania aquatica TaxID=2965069 RepID=UPI0022B4F3FC|nr:lipoprotein [Marortus sp. BJYM1]
MVSFRVFALCSVVLLGACGQTGPLVLPSEDGDIKPASTSAADTSAESLKITTDTATPSAEE